MNDDDWAWSVLGDANARAVQAVVRPMLEENRQDDAYGRWLERPAESPVVYAGGGQGMDWRVLATVALIATVPMLVAVWALTREQSR